MKHSLWLGIFLIFNGLLSAQQVLPDKCSTALRREFSSPPDSNLMHLAVADLPGFQSWAESHGFECVQVYRPAKVIVLRTSKKDFLEKILPNPTVLFADRGDTKPREELPVPGHNLFLNKISLAHSEFPGLNGSGTTVSVKENRFDTADVDLKNRATSATNASQQNTSHANITATLIGGAGNADLAGQGVAWGAQLVSHGFNNLLPDEDYAEKNISVQNHSYGVEIENYYGTGAFTYDVSTVEHPTLLHVFSAGNRGLETSNSGVYANLPGFANLTGNFKMAKNVLTVGMVDSFAQSVGLSSRGPAFDGRVKPDLVAYGAGGTSESAALVSGAAAVIQQALREQTGDLPDAALVRAILLNSADDVDAPGLDFTTGFGNLNLKKSLETVENQNLETGELGDGLTSSFLLDVPSNVAQFKITLAWNDPSAVPNAPKALVNDLDLKVVAPDGSVFLPWVLSHFPHPDSLRLPALRRRDTLNNLEQITFDFPAGGQYAIQVSGTKIRTLTQTFSVVWHWEIEDEFSWHFPQKNAPVVAAHEVIVSWGNTFSDSTGRLEIRYVGEQNWQEVPPEIDLRKGWARWLVPDVFVEAQLRMQVGNQFFESDTFLIAKQLRIDVGFDCPDSVGLFWDAAAPGAGYLLSGLGERYLETLFTTGDTFVVLQKADFPQKKFSVASLGQSGKHGARSPAPDISQQGVGCYFENFLATLNDDSQTDLSLSIGTRYGVESVVFEKMKNSVFEPVKTWQPVASETFAFTDEFPQKGVNRYRVRLNLLSGATLFSDTAEVYLLEEGEVLVFPNPAASQSILNVVSSTSNDAVFAVFDVCGKLVLEKKLDDVRAEIALPSLPHGVYFWRLKQNGQGLKGGRLVLSF